LQHLFFYFSKYFSCRISRRTGLFFKGSRLVSWGDRFTNPAENAILSGHCPNPCHSVYAALFPEAISSGKRFRRQQAKRDVLGVSGYPGGPSGNPALSGREKMPRGTPAVL
jgi:hypothetical protein